jgi:methionyl-tRNA formyltransferase
LLVETLDLLAADALEPTPQDDSAATLAPSFKKQDGQIDWSQSATVLERRVRALQPWPGAFTFVGGQRLGIWMANTEPSPDGKGASRSAGVAGVPDGSVEGPVDESFRAGTVAISGPTGLAIACGDGELLWIEEVQLAGRKRQAVGEFLRGHEMLVGSLLGNEE